MKALAAVALALATASGPAAVQPGESVSCGSNIVSATVVATYCGHRVGNDEVMELLVLWRGAPGWFQGRGALSGTGGGVTAGVAAGITGGVVYGAAVPSKGSMYTFSTYGDVSIGVDANFDAGTVKIGEENVALNGVNLVLVDAVDEGKGRHIAGTRWIEPKLPLAGDLNLLLAQRSPEVRDYLRCEVPMPERTDIPPQFRDRIPPVVTVCDRLAQK